ncbi:hypothetical protein AAFC00_003396 [Neodothiora populina]|uniref:Imidazoleglycerol-phosphate dehydratase n=1 Tax=Neodothiora populina TaxID=2781224 RepID=A0ABR3PE43_9PEZI
MTRTRGHLDSEETNAAAWEATRGAVTGAARWGVYSAVLGGLAYAASPVYRGLTIQFKVFLQMSGMVAGSMIEADNRLRAHEWNVRQHRKLQRDAAVWKQYEEEYDRFAVGVGGGSGTGSTTTTTTTTTTRSAADDVIKKEEK